MEAKKTSKANLQNKKNLFFEVGLAFSLIAVLLAFNWSSNKLPEIILVSSNNGDAEIEESVPITQHTPPPPQEVPQVPIVPEEIVIVDNTIIIDGNFNFSESEAKENLFSNLTYVNKPQVIKDEKTVEETIPFPLVEHKPQFQGKDANEFSKWVNSKIVYPPAAENNNIQGNVLISFVVNANGTLSDIKSIRKVDPLLEEEVMRVIKMSPKWEPGRQQGKAVKVPYQVPFQFKIQN